MVASQIKRLVNPSTVPDDLAPASNELPEMEALLFKPAVASLETASFSLETKVWSSAAVCTSAVVVTELVEDWLLSFLQANINKKLAPTTEIRRRLFVFIIISNFLCEKGFEQQSLMHC